MRPRTRLRPAARIARERANSARAELDQRNTDADQAILAAMASAKLPISSTALAALTGLNRSKVEHRLRALRAASRVRWVPGTTWTPGWAFPRADTPRT